ncbi:5'-nucleotidase domain-containing protein 2-like isoform X3 [Mobula hypostoma]|uniref:5'-nucleotidase domain-containing protein 2-like isoform X3 n=1 Tax=Mobula hypostoma TaxID=723540 RepID=UPI002FC332E3
MALSALMQMKTMKCSAVKLAVNYCTKAVDLPGCTAQATQHGHVDNPSDSSVSGKPVATATAASENKTYLWGRYNEMKKLVHDLCFISRTCLLSPIWFGPLKIYHTVGPCRGRSIYSGNPPIFYINKLELIPPGICHILNPANIYSNNEVKLGNIEIYGFDYDYTLAQYSNSVHTMIFDTAREILIDEYKGVLMKIDAFHYAQLGTAYRGLNPVPDDEVLHMYEGTQHVPLHQMSDFYGKGPSMKQFMDIFSLPEMTLLSCVNDYFINHNIEYDPVHLFRDVSDAISNVHIKGMMYKWIENDFENCILHGDETYAVLNRLVNDGKKLFLITNSPFNFVDKGMKYMVGKDWRDLFDLVIVQADKPSFFTDKRKPFRRLDDMGTLQWDKISTLEKGKMYKQGNLFDFLRLTGWRGSKVLYFGDHLYSDLADLMLRHGWRTGAIVPELETEISIINTEQFTHGLTWLQALTGLLERLQVYQDAESKQVLDEWIKERQELMSLTKNLFNPQFGSIFRTHHNPTYFSRRLCRFSDIYMSSISCLLNYDTTYTFYPRRTPLQHEAPLWMDQLCTGCMKTPFLEEMVHIR